MRTGLQHAEFTNSEGFKDASYGTLLEDFFVLHEPHCQGFEEDRDWSIAEWTGDQGRALPAVQRHLMQIITHPRITKGDPLGQQQQMFFVAAYNLDRFREFVYEAVFFSSFEFADEEATLSVDELLELSFRWLKFFFSTNPNKGSQPGLTQKPWLWKNESQPIKPLGNEVTSFPSGFIDKFCRQYQLRPNYPFRSNYSGTMSILPAQEHTGSGPQAPVSDHTGADTSRPHSGIRHMLPTFT